MKRKKYKALLQRIEDLETAVGELQGTKDITDVPLTDKLIENEMEHTFGKEDTERYYSRAEEQADIATAAYYDEIARMEQASWERFNTRFENLPEQGGPYIEE